MLQPDVHARRRHALAQRVSGPILLLGVGTRARNLPMNAVPFRQDSNVLYLTGCDLPDIAALLDGDRCTLWVPPADDDDALWHGHVDSFEDLAARYGVDEVRAIDDLDACIAGRAVRTLAVSDPARNARLEALTGRPHVFGRDHGDPELVDALIALRRTKGPEELAAMREAASISAAAHRAVMAATRPGVHERALTALFEAFLAARGCTTGYTTILTQRGEVLHNHAHDAHLESGRLLLLDGGGELASGYGADITRTWPVSGRFTGRQRAAYEAVLEAQAAATARCTPGTWYREVHDTACRVLARFLLDEGLLHGTDVDTAVERGAHALFFPHGVGHLLGLDVHDLEAFGDLPAWPPGVGRPEPFGTRYLRLNLPLEAGWVVTVEPGFYVVPAILHDRALLDRFRDVVDPARAEAWAGFGGIRIEDDVVITAGAPEVLTGAVPRDIDAIEALVGAGLDLETVLG